MTYLSFVSALSIPKFLFLFLLRSSNEAVPKLENELENWISRSNDLDLKLKNLTEQLSASVENRDSLTSSNLNYQKKIDELSLLLKENDANLEQERKTLSSLLNERDLLQSLNNELKQQNESYSSTILDNKNQVVALQQELSNSRVLMESLSMKCQRMEEAQVKMKDQEAMINSLQSELSNMEELKAKVSKHQAFEVLFFISNVICNLDPSITNLHSLYIRSIKCFCESPFNWLFT